MLQIIFALRYLDKSSCGGIKICFIIVQFLLTLKVSNAGSVHEARKPGSGGWWPPSQTTVTSLKQSERSVVLVPSTRGGSPLTEKPQQIHRSIDRCLKFDLINVIDHNMDPCSEPVGINRLSFCFPAFTEVRLVHLFQCAFSLMSTQVVVK